MSDYHFSQIRYRDKLAVRQMEHLAPERHRRAGRQSIWTTPSASRRRTTTWPPPAAPASATPLQPWTTRHQGEGLLDGRSAT